MSENITYIKGPSLRNNNKQCLESTEFLGVRVLIVKWLGPWPSLAKIKDWCDKHWGCVVSLETMENGFLLLTCTCREDKEWILENSSYLIDG